MKGIWRWDPWTALKTILKIEKLVPPNRYSENRIRLNWIIPGHRASTSVSRFSPGDLSCTAVEANIGDSFVSNAHKWTLMARAALWNEYPSYNTSTPNCGNAFTPEHKHDYHSLVPERTSAACLKIKYYFGVCANTQSTSRIQNTVFKLYRVAYRKI